MQEGAVDDSVTQDISSHFPLLSTQWDQVCSQMQLLSKRVNEEYAAAMKYCLDRLGPDFNFATDEPKLRRFLNEYVKAMPENSIAFGRAMVAMQKTRQTANQYLAVCSPKEFGVAFDAFKAAS
jgi:hypothetical protein